MRTKDKLIISLIVIVSLLTGFIAGSIATSDKDLVRKQTVMIGLQRELIDTMSNHFWNYHDCDLNYLDSEIQDSILHIEYELNNNY